MADELEPKEVLFHYIKSTDFTTRMATGGIGGVTVNGLINLNLYSDRVVIPNLQQVEISSPETPKHSEGKGGYVRELFCGVLLDSNTAKAIVQWLNNQVEIVEGIKTKSDENTK